MKILKTLFLSCVCAVVMTFSAAAFLGGVENDSLLSPGKDKAEVSQVIMDNNGGCTLIFSLDGHAISIDEPATEKCDTYSPGQTVTF